MKENIDQIIEEYRRSQPFNYPLPPLSSLPALIDHTLLKPEAREEEIVSLCQEAKDTGFYSVCVNSCWVPRAREELQGSPVKVITVVGFPLGAESGQIKLDAALWAKKEGAAEIDMVMNIGYLKSGKIMEVKDEIKEIVEKTAIPIKVIIETCLLSDEEKIQAALLIEQGGGAFVKTSTGFSSKGATVEDVRLLRFASKGKIRVKASGGIRTLKQALEVIQAGAERIGTSSGMKIIEEAKGATL